MGLGQKMFAEPVSISPDLFSLSLARKGRPSTLEWRSQSWVVWVFHEANSQPQPPPNPAPRCIEGTLQGRVSCPARTRSILSWALHTQLKQQPDKVWVTLTPIPDLWQGKEGLKY